jgi:D-inositol-3-phosphate glycosyltransferase
MNISMLSVHTGPLAKLGGKETGGMNVYVRELSRALALRGHRVDIFTRRQDPNVPYVEADRIAPGVRVVNITAGPPTPYEKNHLFELLPEFAHNVQTFAEAERIFYDVYHAHYWLSGWVARELQACQRAPVVQMFHTLGAIKNLVANDSAREPDQRIEIEVSIMNFASRIIASTPRDRQQMIELYGADESKIAIIPPGVDLNLFHPIANIDAKDFIEAPYDHHTVLFVGRIDPIKGIDTWFRAMKLVIEENPDLRGKMCVCLIGGDVDEELTTEGELSRLDALKNELGIGDLVTFLGRRAQESLPYYYSAADVVVMPSLYESFGMVALEAMACGAPVVASDVGGLSYLVRDGETGFLVPDRDPRALADCLNRLLCDKTLRSELGNRGTQVAKDYAWSEIAEQIEGVYKEIVK